MHKVISIVGARPQFIKFAPLSLELKKQFNSPCINTGQHYDDEMSRVFFQDFDIPEPDFDLGVGSGNHAVQISAMLDGISQILVKEQPDFVIVFGDTNSTMAGALAASKLKIPIAHVEAGLRSFNRDMPEETNRILTDHLSDLLFAPTQSAVINLETEGVTKGVIKSPDIMADALEMARKHDHEHQSIEPYFLATIHRNYNTDNPVRLRSLFDNLDAANEKIIFPIHPRTAQSARAAEIDLSLYANIEFVSPLGYFDFVSLLAQSDGVLTDSGGLQKEAYILEVPCITLRHETEWVETLEGQWNVLIGEKFDEIPEQLNRQTGQHDPDLFGDGNAAAFITKKLMERLETV